MRSTFELNYTGTFALAFPIHFFLAYAYACTPPPSTGKHSKWPENVCKYERRKSGTRTIVVGRGIAIDDL